MKRCIVSFVVIFSLLFCCGSAWHTMLFGNDTSMENHATCGMGDVSGQADSGHHYSIVSSTIGLLKSITQGALAMVLVSILLVLIHDRFTYYFRCIRDRYGGFRLFDFFVGLFSRGILHPKTF